MIGPIEPFRAMVRNSDMAARSSPETAEKSSKQEDPMHCRKTIITVLAVFLALSVTAVITHADEFDQAIKLTFNQPISIPDHTLPAGTYWFALANHGAGAQNVLQVFDGDRKNVIATMIVGTDQVAKSSGHIQLTLADRSPEPQALLTLTYPGRIDGHTFEVSYSSQQRAALSEYPTIRMKVGENGVIAAEETNR